MRKKQNQFGFTMVEVMVGVAILAGLALTAMRLSDYATQMRIRLAGKYELLQLNRKVRMLLENKDACDETFDGLPLKGSSISQTPTPKDQLNPGARPLQAIKPKYALNNGASGEPLFSHDPNDLDSLNRPLNKFGPVIIKAAEIIMPEHLSGLNFPFSNLGTVTYPARFLVHSVTKLHNGREIDNPLLDYRVYLALETDPLGNSVVKGCRSDSLSAQKLYYNSYGSNISQAVEEPGIDGRKEFYFCGFVGQFHSPDKYRATSPLVAHSSESRCKLTPSGPGPFYSWQIDTVAVDGSTRCEVVCL